jgi:hypothetical protein
VLGTASVGLHHKLLCEAPSSVSQEVLTLISCQTPGASEFGYDVLENEPCGHICASFYHLVR